MSEAKPTRDAKTPREERLAAKLRENLHRRKDQARVIKASVVETEALAESPDLPKLPTLPKPPPTR